MLSYMLPVDDKSSTSATTTTTTMNRNFNMSLNLNGSSSHNQPINGNSTLDVIDETTKLLASERDPDAMEQEQNPLLDASQREDSFSSDASSRKIKMSKLQPTTTKSVALKRWVHRLILFYGLSAAEWGIENGTATERESSPAVLVYKFWLSRRWFAYQNGWRNYSRASFVVSGPSVSARIREA